MTVMPLEGLKLRLAPPSAFSVPYGWQTMSLLNAEGRGAELTAPPPHLHFHSFPLPLLVVVFGVD